LAFSFLPSVHGFFSWVGTLFPNQAILNSKFFEMSLFTFFSALLYLTLPNRSQRHELRSEKMGTVIPSFFIPILIALVFGWVQRGRLMNASTDKFQDLFWFTICIPMGEELIFRGWLWAILKSLFKSHFYTLTNPLPAEWVYSSFAFSLWHLQNKGHVSLGFLVFQLVYSLLTGLWLGYLRWTTGKIITSTLAHALINLAASLPMLL
ncbi:MAG: lysostaphin resistance A-like protein, partial [Deltaproteobacteria bacterium]